MVGERSQIKTVTGNGFVRRIGVCHAIKRKEVEMPSTSKNQRSLACMALSMKQGKTPHTYSKQAHKMMGSMSVEELEKMCHTTDKEMKE